MGEEQVESSPEWSDVLIIGGAGISGINAATASTNRTRS